MSGRRTLAIDPRPLASGSRPAPLLFAVPHCFFPTGVVQIAGIVPWCAKYAPVYWRARADGRPG